MGLNVKAAGSAGRGVMLGLTGQPGAGKTTLMSTFPSPLILDLEGGSWVLQEQGTSVHNEWELPKKGRLKEFLGILREVAKTQTKTVCIDSWTRLSGWIEQDILEEDGRAESLNNAFGGYGAGAGAHAKRTEQVLEAFHWLQEHKGMHIVLSMHTKLGTVDLPSGESYSVFGTEGAKQSSARVVMACDMVAQLRQVVDVVQKGAGAGKAMGQGERELFTGPAPYIDTKSRWERHPTVIPVVWGENPFADRMG